MDFKQTAVGDFGGDFGDRVCSPGNCCPETELSCFSDGLLKIRGGGGGGARLLLDGDLDVGGVTGDEDEPEVCMTDLAGESFLFRGGGGFGGRVRGDMFPSNIFKGLLLGEGSGEGVIGELPAEEGGYIGFFTFNVAGEVAGVDEPLNPLGGGK